MEQMTLEQYEASVAKNKEAAAAAQAAQKAVQQEQKSQPPEGSKYMGESYKKVEYGYTFKKKGLLERLKRK